MSPAKAVHISPGLYSGIFLLYLQYRGSTKSTDKANNIIFYALCALYFLSVAALLLDVSDFVISQAVSNNSLHNNDHRFCDFALISCAAP
jgi:hypothetical protein